MAHELDTSIGDLKRGIRICFKARVVPEWREQNVKRARSGIAALRILRAARAGQGSPTKVVRVIFDGPPGPEAGRFVEVEDEHGRSINAGEWRELSGGLWELAMKLPVSTGQGCDSAPDCSGLTDQINALSQPLRQFVMDLETRADPAGDVRARHFAQENTDALIVRVRGLESELKHLRAGQGCDCAEVVETELRSAQRRATHPELDAAAQQSAIDTEMALRRVLREIRTRHPKPPETATIDELQGSTVEASAREWVRRTGGVEARDVASVSHQAIAHVVGLLNAVDGLRRVMREAAKRYEASAASLRSEAESGQNFRQSACCKHARSEVLDSVAVAVRVLARKEP